MAKGRTISAEELTDIDKKALKICEDISNALVELIKDPKGKEDFMENYGRVHFSRDAGLGRAGGKLQRDALCTRGRTDKAPYSNRNLRWHPLIVAMKTPNYAKEVEDIRTNNKSLVFVIEGVSWYPKDVHKLSTVYCAPFDKWHIIKDELVQWSDEDWTNNSCVIPAMEYSTLQFSVETFSILGISVVSNFYGVNPFEAYEAILGIYKNNEHELSQKYPEESEINELILCPLCHAPLSKPPANLNLPEREEVFQPPWRKSKRKEGEAESLQLFHTYPLKESQILHTPELVRYGHRWCNVAMADHSVKETVDFMYFVAVSHKRKR